VLGGCRRSGLPCRNSLTTTNTDHDGEPATVLSKPQTQTTMASRPLFVRDTRASGRQCTVSSAQHAVCLGQPTPLHTAHTHSSHSSNHLTAHTTSHSADPLTQLTPHHNAHTISHCQPTHSTIGRSVVCRSARSAKQLPVYEHTTPCWGACVAIRTWRSQFSAPSGQTRREGVLTVVPRLEAAMVVNFPHTPPCSHSTLQQSHAFGRFGQQQCRLPAATRGRHYRRPSISSC
jgi:hypothetical protein